MGYFMDFIEKNHAERSVSFIKFLRLVGTIDYNCMLHSINNMNG